MPQRASLSRSLTSLPAVAAASMLALTLAQWPVAAQQSGGRVASVPPARPCRIRGSVASGSTPLPGAAVALKEDGRPVTATSTDLDGSYTLAAAPGTYSLAIELAAFASVERPVTVGEPPCEAVIDAALTLASRTPGYVPPSPQAATASILSGAPTAGGQPASAMNGRGGPSGAFGGGSRGAGPDRFQSLAVQQASDAPEPTTDTSVADDDPARRLLPPGFSVNAPQESVTVSGSFVELDRTQMNDRLLALGRGEFGLGDGQPFGPPVETAGAVQGPGAGGPGGGRGGGGPGGFGGLGGPGGRGGAARLQANATYGLGGSMFDAAPYSLRGEATQKPDYLQQNFSTTVGGPLRIPRLYNGTNRTAFNVSYTGSHTANIFDQYATVPSDAFRTGDFSASTTPIIDPLTGEPFAGNQIPQDRLSPAALGLLRYIPSANLTGDTRNFHRSATTRSASDQVSLRLTHAFTQVQAGRGGRGGAGGRGGGPTGAGTTAGGTTAGQAGRGQPAGAQAAGGQGRGGRGAFQPPLNVTMTAAINYRQNSGDRNNVYPLLTGATNGSTVSVPVTLNIRAGRSMHAVGTTFGRTTSTTRNQFASTTDVAGLAGITGVATDPFDWGVPSLTFGSYTAVRDTTPSRRRDHSWQVTYGWTRPAGAHTLRAGGSFQQQISHTQSDSNARGTFTFTGLYTAGGLGTLRGSGQDFADFLLGLPQQATRQYSLTTDTIGQTVTTRGRSLSLYLQDDWRWKANWTFNLGVQYDLVAPFVETSGRMVNLDAAPGFTAVAAVTPGTVGPYSGAYGSALLRPDWNNLAPKIGVAWRANARSVVRFGYGLTYASEAYAAIARNLTQQPPYFQTGTSLGTLAAPLTLSHAFDAIAPSTLTNTYGVDADYALGLIQQWTADYSRDLFRTWSVGATYIGTRGVHLDMLRAPNRGPTGLRIAGVQAFTWQSSEGASSMNGLALRLQKRQSHGISGTASYTLSKSRDNTTATGGGATVAQNDQDLDAEWGLSNFDRRHQFTGSAAIELPWGRNRRWLNGGGWLASLAGDWSMSTNLSWLSGTPLTARCSSCAADVATGVVGTLRADYTGLPIALDAPTIDQYFNTAAFAVPTAGTFGSSGRNVIIGPGSHLLSAQFTRDVALGGTRGLSINVMANNLLNTVNFAAIDTNVNSPTFGQVLSVNGRRTVRVTFRFRF